MNTITKLNPVKSNKPQKGISSDHYEEIVDRLHQIQGISELLSYALGGNNNLSASASDGVVITLSQAVDRIHSIMEEARQ